MSYDHAIFCSCLSPSELWPQISVLGGRRKDGIIDETSGIFVDEAEFMSKYVLKGERGADEIGSKSKLAELHTLLTSTIMIRRMKVSLSDEQNITAMLC